MNWRIRLAFWIAGPREIAEAASLEIVSESRNVALEEAAKICDDIASHSSHEGRQALEYAASCIRYRAARIDLFKQTLKGRMHA